MRYIFSVFLLFTLKVVCAQTTLTIEGKTYTNSDETWMGVNIPRSAPTVFTFRNNSITSANTYGYMLQAGDEEISVTNNNLDGAVITGNKFTWNGSDMKSITHGLFSGQNINALIKYNYLDHVPMGIIRKSASNMVNTAGGVAYNIVKGGAVAINIKGMSNVNIYNNTLYTDRTTSETWRGLIYIYTHIDVIPNSVAHGTKIYNNIFYTKYQTYCIQVDDAESTIGFESDYNIFYCESGTPVFYYCGTRKTFAEWQALGYDIHSKVINPNFKDLTNFVPVSRLDYGTDLGSAWAEGLSVNARWGTTDPEKTMQNGKWQVGAIIYKEVTTLPAQQNQPPSVSISSPTKGNAFVAPATVTIDANAFDNDGTVSRVEFYNGPVKLGEKTSAPWSFTWKEVAEGTYSLTAAATDNSSARTVSDPVTVVVEKAASAINQLPSVNISMPKNNVTLTSPATINLTAIASDPDGTVTRVEYFLDQDKIGESFASPYSCSVGFDREGTYDITAVAYDNLNGSSMSAPLRISVLFNRGYPDLINLYPNPNNGNFFIDINLNQEEYGQLFVTIFNLSGRTVYKDLIASAEGHQQIDISTSLAGNYVITVSNQNGILSTKQFIKQ